MSENENNEALFMRMKDEISKRELSNSENYDKTILTYSGFGLTFSMAFIKDVVPLKTAIGLSTLYASWIFFVCAIICVIISYFMSQKGLKRQIQIAECYYLKNCDKAFELPNKWAKLTDNLNMISGALFILGVILNTYFCYININNQGAQL